MVSFKIASEKKQIMIKSIFKKTDFSKSHGDYCYFLNRIL